MNNFCAHCGSSIAGGNNCPNCGAPVMMQPVDNNVNNMQINSSVGVQPIVDDGFVNKKAKKAIILEVISFFILGFLSYVGLYLSIEALKEANMHNGKGKSLAITGIIAGVVLSVLYTINLFLSFN